MNVKSGVNTLLIKEEIPNPFVWYKQKTILKNAESIAVLNHDESKHLLRTLLRKQYFLVKKSEKLWKTSKRELELVKQLFDHADKRYNKGLIHKHDFQRATLLRNQIQAKVSEQVNQLEIEIIALKRLLNIPEAQKLNLKTDLPSKFAFSTMDVSSILSKSALSKSHSFRALELRKDNQDLKRQIATAEAFPDLAFGVSYQQQDPNRNTYQENGPTYYFSLKWDVFNGGKDYYAYKAERAESEAVKFELESESKNSRLKIKKLVHRLKLLETSFQDQAKVVKVLDEIVTTSKTRYNSGTLSSDQLTEDIRDYLQAESKLIELNFELVSSIADLSFESGNSELFKTLL